MFGDVNDLQAMTTLSYLGFGGQHWSAIDSAGGPCRFLQTEPVHRDQIQKALGFCLPRLEIFQKHDGAVLGANGFHELGRFAKAPKIPLCVFARGDCGPFADARLKVGIIGTRKPSETGLQRAHAYAAKLARSGCAVVSGGAYGIDMAAHEGALSAGGATLCGLGDAVNLHDDERPRRVRGLAPRKLLTTFTTFGPSDAICPASFIERNQYVAALCDALIVIEGQAKSGTIHTARFAHRMQIPVFAIPGDPEHGLAGAANLLLAEGIAKPMLGLDAFAKSLSLKLARTVRSEESQTQGALSLFATSAPKNLIVAAVKKAKTPLSVDDLCVELRLPAADIHPILFELELTGQIKRRGAFFVLP